jgi:glyoxylase I family protein
MSQQQAITVRTIDHVVIRVLDLPTMVAFYSDVLGCGLERGPGEAGLAQLRAGSSLIDLLDVEGPPGRQEGRAGAPGVRNMDHFCLQVEPWDADAILAHLKSHGVEPGDPVMRYGARGSGPSIYIQDPEGNKIELKGPPQV